MRSFIYRSSTKLTCSCDSDIILCLTDNLLADGSDFLPATLTNIITTADCNGCDSYNYYLEYDETLLTDPTYVLNSFDITGIFCKGCQTAYLEYLINSILTHSPSWLLAGNGGNTIDVEFCGTTDDVPFDVRVNNQRARRTVPDADCPILIDGYSGNVVGAGVSGGAVLSGGSSSAINSILSTYSDDPVNYAYNSVIAGGYTNTIDTCVASVIGGGERHSITLSDVSFIGGGALNIIEMSAQYRLGAGNGIIFGRNNYITEANHCSIIAGAENTVNYTESSCVVAGVLNVIGDVSAPLQAADAACIVAGKNNYIVGSWRAFIGAGSRNRITNAGDEDLKGNTILAGQWNLLEDTDASAILGGVGLQLGTKSVGYQAADTIDEATPNYTYTDLSAFSGIAYFGNVDLWIGNITGVARKVKFFEPNVSVTYTGTNYSSFEAQVQAANLEYKLPAAAGAPGTSLKIKGVVGTVVTLEWA